MQSKIAIISYYYGRISTPISLYTASHGNDKSLGYSEVHVGRLL